MKNKKTSIAFSSVVAGLFLTSLKLIVGVLTGSIGIISEAAHSAMDLIAALITFFAVKESDRPADSTHHYGHGKIENISAFIETLLLIATSFWIIFEAIKRLSSQHPEIEVAWYSFAVMSVSIIVDYTRSKALYRVAKETKSQALEADALHFHTDIYSSSVVILGLIFYSLGIKGADAIAAIIVALFVLYAAYSLGKRTIDELLDKAPEGLENEIKILVDKVDGVIAVERLRIRKTGPEFFIDIVINVNRTISLENVDQITKKIQKLIAEKLDKCDVAVHVNPVAVSGESIIERVQTIVSNHQLSAHDINVLASPEKLLINFDLEVGSDLSLKDAHAKANHLEKTIINEFGKKTKVYVHIEPHDSTTALSQKISEHEKKEINEALKKANKNLKQIKNIHDVEISKVNGKYNLSLHFFYGGQKSVENAHLQASLLETKIKKLLPRVKSVNIHAEPQNFK